MLSFLYVYSDHSILECYNLFSGVELSMRSFFVIYKNLFSEEEVDLEAQDWLLGQLSMSLDEQEQALCEGLLTVEECREALNGMDTGKSPGVDGLTAEFYLAFWAVLGDLVEVLNYGFQNGQLSVSQRRGLLSLIFEKGEKRI